MVAIRFGRHLNIILESPDTIEKYMIHERLADLS